jgi:hypothetical protein
MDLILAVTRGLLIFLERDDTEMSNLFARSFLTLDAMYSPVE